MRRIILTMLLLVALSLQSWLQKENEIFLIETGKISFKSEAPLELIQAVSNDLAGAINPANHTFAFTIPMNTFDGFNSALQKEHFRENERERGCGGKRLIRWVVFQRTKSRPQRRKQT